MESPTMLDVVIIIMATVAACPLIILVLTIKMSFGERGDATLGEVVHCRDADGFGT